MVRGDLGGRTGLGRRALAVGISPAACLRGGHCKKRRLGSAPSALHYKASSGACPLQKLRGTHVQRSRRGSLTAARLDLSSAPDGARASSGEQRRLDRIRRTEVQDRLQRVGSG